VANERDGLGRWGKGNSGNPNGRPRRGNTLADELRKVLNRKGPDGKKNNVAIAEKLVELARSGEVKAIREIFDRVDGRALQPIEHGGVGGAKNVLITVVYDDVENNGS